MGKELVLGKRCPRLVSFRDGYRELSLDSQVLCCLDWLLPWAEPPREWPVPWLPGPCQIKVIPVRAAGHHARGP